MAFRSPSVSFTKILRRPSNLRSSSRIRLLRRARRRTSRRWSARARPGWSKRSRTRSSALIPRVIARSCGERSKRPQRGIVLLRLQKRGSAIDNITHTLAGALLGEMGLKRRSRFAFAACLLGANAPDIDVFAPLVLPVDGIAFHRGPLHAVLAWPVLAAAILSLLWLVDRLKPGARGSLPFRPAMIFLIAFLAVL